MWANNAIQQTWLAVVVNADPNTGLTSPDVFFFGSEIGDDGVGDTTTAFTNSTDDLGARNNAGVAQNTNVFDYNRDGFVNSSDSLVVRNNTGNLRFINVSDPPSAPQASPSVSPASSVEAATLVASPSTASASPAVVTTSGNTGGTNGASSAPAQRASSNASADAGVADSSNVWQSAEFGFLASVEPAWIDEHLVELLAIGRRHGGSR